VLGKSTKIAWGMLLVGCVELPKEYEPDPNAADGETGEHPAPEIPDLGGESEDDSPEPDQPEEQPETDTDEPLDDLPAPLDAPAKQLALGNTHTCVLGLGGSVHCWGDNWWGQLGLGHTEALGDDELPNVAGPVPLPGPAVELAAGRHHTCARLDSGEVICWGENRHGQLGRGDLRYIGNNETPSLADAVDVGGEVASIHAGGSRTCAITTEQELLCWGENWRNTTLGYAIPGDVGDDETPSAAGPVDVGGPVLSVALGRTHTCALLDGGSIRCWGSKGAKLGVDVDESIGDDEVPASIPPVELAGPAVAIAAGYDHTCALLEGGAVSCWGDGGDGALGYGNFENVTFPALVDPVNLGAPAVAIELGENDSCALTADGSAYCWGGDVLGYPGVLGFIGGELRPVDVGPLALPGPVLEIDSDGATCARIGVDVVCWGTSAYGATGSGTDETIGDDEPPGSAGPVQYLGGEGNGGVAPSFVEFDGIVDARLRLNLDTFGLPMELDPGQTIRARGAWQENCEICNGSFAVRTGDDETLIVASIEEQRELHPPLGVLAMLGFSIADFAAPLALHQSDPGLCAPIEVENECGEQGNRLLLEVVSPDDPPASLLDMSQGHAGSGYFVAVERLQEVENSKCYPPFVGRRALILRQDCAPDCGPVATMDSCEDPAEVLASANISFVDDGTHEMGFDVSCVIVDQYPEWGAWIHTLDCVWNL
jgi:alpha-tubulin suppressor-like RCC1 family protein